MISQRTIEEVRNRVRIGDLVAEVTPLKRQGSRLVGLCPFHAEKTPSFYVNEEGLFHCFGCGASGNVISFLMRAKGLSFPEAVEELAARVGVHVERIGTRNAGQQRVDREEFYRINRAAFLYFRHSLKANGVECRNYLHTRKLDESSVRAFGAGFAPRQRSGLCDYLKSKGFTDDLIARSGLARREASGDLMDMFRGRLVFPILIDRRRIAGFGGRVLPALFDKETLQNTPKYLNSPESPVYQKSKVLFGLPQALQAIRHSRTVFVVEGYLDVIALWQSGVKNTVATCGTALTAEHVRRLSQLAKEIVLLFDGDAAGRAAAGKSYPQFVNSGMDAHCAFLPEGHDPDTFAHANAADVAAALAGLKRVHVFEAYVNYLCERESGGSGGIAALGAASKGKVCEQLAKTLSLVENSVERGDLTRIAAHMLRVQPSAFEGMLGSALRDGQQHALNDRDRLQSGKGDEAESESAQGIPEIQDLQAVDREILRAVMGLRRRCAEQLLAEPDLCDSVHPAVIAFSHELLEILSESGSSDEQKLRIRELLDRCGNSWLKLWKVAFEMAQVDSAGLEKAFSECVRRVRRERVLDARQELENELSLAQTEEQKLTLLQAQLELTRRAHALDEGR